MTLPQPLQDTLNALGVLPLPKHPEPTQRPAQSVWLPSTPEEEPPF